MKKMISALLVCFTMLSTAKAESYVDYVSIGFAVQNMQNPTNDTYDGLLNDDAGTAIVLNAGKKIYDDIAVEFEGTTTITKPEWSLINDSANTAEVDFWSMGLYGVYVWKINNLDIKPRVGVVYEHMKSDNFDSNSIKASDKSDIAISGGIGLSYNFGQNYAVYTNFTKFEDDMNHLTFGAEYKF